MKPSPERLREIIDYDPAEGTFRWAVSRRGARKGDPCGRICQFGYREIGVDYGLYRANMIAWAIMTGQWPDKDVDHINRVKSDNRWFNLRIANRSQNNGNEGLRTTNTSGRKGVVWDKDRRKWRAQIGVGGKVRNLGRFDKIEDAAAAYDKAAMEGYGEYAVTNADLALELHR